ncbi:hypothetical protein MVEN_02541000 [Mycena venus]|uniref:Uncharacterized protein n=1 Tax=Mycena venus TaxID=2733690 RepID=A0A8H6TZU8_9AGAR|nr:hypothetical protein MVEN_02541000 [Mycena venus]
MERVVFPPVPAERVQSRYHVHPGEEMDVDIDIEGEAAPRVRVSSAASLHPSLTPPRLGSPSPFAASSSSTALHPSSSTSTFPIASSSSSIAHLSTTHPTKATSSSSSKTTPSLKPKRLAGPGVPPPSPEAPAARWGPLIGAARGVRAVERERGSGGWGGVMLDREVVLDAAAGFAGYGYGTTEGYFGDGFGERYARGGYTAAGTSANEYAASSSKPYELVERAGGWDVVPDGAAYGVKGSETEEDGEVDVVGGGIATDDPTREDRVRGKTRRRESKREVVPESVCPPKMRKKWKADVPAPTYDLPRGDKGKGKAPVQEETMAIDVDGAVDVVAIDAEERPPSPPPRLSLVPPPPPPRFRSPLAPSLPGVPGGPSPSTRFARLSLMSPHPSSIGPRQAWFSVGASANVEVLEHGDVPGVQWRRKEEEEERVEESNVDNEAVSATAAVDALPSADAVAGTSPSAELETVGPVEVIASPGVHFVEPVVHADSEPPHVESSNDVHAPEEDEGREDILLLTVPEDESYRPSPASPSPAPESEEEDELPIALRVEGGGGTCSSRAQHSASTKRAGGIPGNTAAAFACVGQR